MMEIRKLAPGDRILDYRILEQIGEGGFGEVFRAEHEVLGRVVAIKVPRDLEALSALRLEGVIQARLDHPGIVKTLEISISHDPPYVVMEYIEGTSLRRVVEQGAMAWRRAVTVLIDICDALDYAHKQGVVHGDIKPGNILIQAEGKPSAKITDFGLGRVFEGTQGNLQISRSLNFVESASEVVGTLRYLAPEVQRGEAADEQADVYSIGVLLFEMLTGSLPEGRELPSDVKKGLPSALDDIFSSCYIRKNRRVRSLGELRDKLQAVLETGASTTPERRSPRERAAPCQPEPSSAPTPPVLVAAEPQEVESPRLDFGPAVALADNEAFELVRERLWASVREMVTTPEGIEEVAAHGFDVAFGIVTEGDPQHRVFACAPPRFDAEAARRFVAHASRVFELEKGLWEKEVTFVIATQDVEDREKVDWALRSFATGWWRRRRVVLYDIAGDRVVARDYGCDPLDNELKKGFLEQLQVVNREIQRDQEQLLALHSACQQRSSRLGTALTVLSTFCLIAVGLTFQSNGGCRPMLKKKRSETKVPLVRPAVTIGPAEELPELIANEPEEKPAATVKRPIKTVPR